MTKWQLGQPFRANDKTRLATLPSKFEILPSNSQGSATNVLVSVCHRYISHGFCTRFSCPRTPFSRLANVNQLIGTSIYVQSLYPVVIQRIKAIAMYNPKLPRCKTSCMSLILQLVQKGYRHWTSGTVESGKARRLADKFADAYLVHLNMNQRAYKQRKGEANAYLVMFPSKDQDSLHWFLLATPGIGAIHQGECLKNATTPDGHLQWGPYELTQRAKSNGALGWTWRRPKRDMESWYVLLDREAKQPSSHTIQRSITAIANSPGFAGVREQNQRLFEFIAKNTRHRLEYPFVPWVRFLKIYDEPAMTLTAWVESRQMRLARPVQTI